MDGSPEVLVGAWETPPSVLHSGMEGEKTDGREHGIPRDPMYPSVRVSPLLTRLAPCFPSSPPPFCWRLESGVMRGVILKGGETG